LSIVLYYIVYDVLAEAIALLFLCAPKLHFEG
jgi:hypothetical protein